MLKHLVIAAILTASVATMTSTSAFADSDDDNNDHGQRWSVERDHRIGRANTHARKMPSRKIVVERKVHRQVVDGTLPIRRMLDIDRSYAGYRVKNVMVKIKPYQSHGRIKLLVNGYAVDRERLTDARWITLRTNGDKTIGRDLSSLKLAVRGRVYIKAIRVTLAEPRSRRIYGDATPPHTKVVIKTRRVATDPIERIVRVILRDIRHSGRNL